MQRESRPSGLNEGDVRSMAEAMVSRDRTEDPGQTAASSTASPVRLEAAPPSRDFLEPFAGDTPCRVIELPDPETWALLEAIHSVGGRPLIVGGFVRDALMGRPAKDVDIEVHGLQAEDLARVLSRFGQTDLVGASFGVIKLWSTGGQEYDFTLPRRDNKTGAGHRGFQVDVDPALTPEEAAARRDFTINSLAYDPFTQTVIDPYNGLEDLDQAFLRHTSEAFREDPLRVLRGMQFAARFDMKMPGETAEICREMASEYPTLARERVWGEWEKLATKGVWPSRGLQVLQETGWLSHYPELESLVGVPQEPEWHPEGDVWAHTLHTTNAAARIADREGLAGEGRAVLVLAALCHDLGKPAVTVKIDGRIRSRGHEPEGVEPTQRFLDSIGCPKAIAAKVLPLVGNHLSHLGFPEDHSTAIQARFIRRLADRLVPSNVQTLGYLIEADHGGRPPLPPGLPRRAEELIRMAKDLNLLEQPPKPIVMGRHLLEAGHQPGPGIGSILKQLYNLQLDGAFTTVQEGLDLLGQHRESSPPKQVPPEPADDRKPRAQDQVISFTKVAFPFGWLGNMSPHPVVHNGRPYRTTEALFHCLRFQNHPEIAERIRAERSPMGAKRVSREHFAELSEGELARDIEFMRICLRLKVQQHPELAKQLVGTGDLPIIEDVTRRPRGKRWGMALEGGEWVGENLLGVLWMELRQELRAKATQS